MIVALLLLFSGQAFAAPILTYNTGVDTGTAGSPGTTGTAGSVTSSWTLTSVTGASAGAFSNSATTEVRINRHGAWTAGGTDAAGLAASTWITPHNTTSGANGLSGANLSTGTFVYQTTFDLAGYDVASAIISGSFGADNRADVYLNGNLLAGHPPDPYQGGHLTAGWLNFNSTTDSHFLAGTNVLEVRVQNVATGGPTGFRVAYGVTADANAVPEIDSSSACLPLAMVLIGFLALSDRKRREILA